MALSTFNVSDIIVKLAEAEKLTVDVTGIDDVCNGIVISADKSFSDFLSQHRGPYNFQVLDGSPIRIIRRAVNDSLVIDFNINETDCIVPSQGAPAVQFSRLDPESLPGEVQVSYIDPDRYFTQSVQTARHLHAKKYATNVATTTAINQFGDPLSSHSRLLHTISVDFVITATQAREMAFDYLYRLWSNSVTASFEHPSLTIEPGDTIQLTADAGVFTLLVTKSTITKGRTNQLQCVVLLTSTGLTVTGVTPDTYTTFSSTTGSGSGSYFGRSYFGVTYFGDYE